MPRKNLIRSKENPYHVTARSNNREAFYCNPEDAWKIFNYYLHEISVEHQAKIHAFVMMPNHFHLLISTPSEDLGVVMHKLMLFCTKSMNRNAGRIGHVFGGRYHWSIINDHQHFDHALKYVYRNPVKANLVSKAEDFQFSSLRAHVNQENLKFPLSPIIEQQYTIPNNDPEAFLTWLNNPFKKEQDEAISKALKRPLFNPKAGWKRNSTF